MKSLISTQSYKGARDFYPQDMLVRNFIFDKWKSVMRSYGFEEYDFPILEPLEIFAAKSGEELIRDQIFSFEDRGGRKLAMRPEITPGTVRLIAQRFKELPQPIKWFMIGNNWRYEKPQSGRGREFYQLEVNIFGVDGIIADFEIFSIIISLMKAFGANQTMFEILVSDRRLISALLVDVLKLNDEQQTKIRRLMDKKDKMSREEFTQALKEAGLSQEGADKVVLFMEGSIETLSNSIPESILNNNQGYINLKKLFEMLKENDMAEYCKFDPSIIRGFDYSDGLVYEVFDKSPENNRSMFGGERFDQLISIFGDFTLPSTGFAMGDYTLLEFLKYWKLLPEMEQPTEYLVTVWPSDDSKYFNISQNIASGARSRSKNVFLWPNTNDKLEKQLKYADRKGIRYVVICGEEEIKSEKVTVKDLKKNEQKTYSMEEFLKTLN